MTLWHFSLSITASLADEAADSSFAGIDFVPDGFVGGPVQRGAVLYTLEGDFGFSGANATASAPEVGHEVKLINFNRPGVSLALKMMRCAHNTTFEWAFVDELPGGFNRPTNIRFRPDDCAYVVVYGTVRDFGQSDRESNFITPEMARSSRSPGLARFGRSARPVRT